MWPHESPPSGRGAVIGFKLGVGKRARMELEAALLELRGRLEAIESTPLPTLPLEQIKAGLEAIGVRLDERLEGVQARLLSLESDIDFINTKIKTLTLGIEEGIERVGRAERRIHATVKRARKELSEHGYESPGLEVEAETLRHLDGDGGGDGAVRSLPEGVEPPVEAASSINGVSAETLRRKWGL